MKHMNEKLLFRSLACGLVLTCVLGWLPTAAVAEQLPENIIRLHVVAHSDSAEDQALKLKVRDAVLKEAEAYCHEAESREEANFQICTHLESIAGAANQVVAAEGFPYEARAQVTEMFFPTKDYEGFTLPAGRYRALRVTIGEAKGHNWWCVVFPALCLPAAADQDALASLPKEQREAAQGNYKVRFKLTEWYETVREFLTFE